MRIDNYRLDVTVGPNAGLQPPHGFAGRTGPAAQPPQDASAHTPAPELAQWVAQVHQMDDVRHAIVSEVARRLANGDYLTPGAAERAAEALLNS